ncbi:CBS domain containing-hemolysin-like protein [Actinokineospora baliensis]|uniref:hemolysin family protein n=1 Tax=Actinokineospora baliensis TaxID=547056 RepID=UPI00195B06C7|nr:hemolysin family protein [Actinokineospora baliensis]MBM7772557.1 CBS domain containing-hemolysin-like protein [Actinokineospora baliensis]
MSADSAGLLVIAVLLVLAAGCFAAADASLSAVSTARVEGLVRSGRAGAKQLLAVVAERPRHINLLLLLRLGCELAATVMVTFVCARSISPGWVAGLVAAVGMIVVSYVLVGVGPRTIGRQHPYGVGLIAAGPVRVLGSVLGPLSRFLILVGNAITPGKGFREGPFSSEVELRELVDLAQERGVVDADEREMIHSVFELRGTIAREVMVPRTEMVWIEQTKTGRQALALSLRTGYTRIPVIGESVDDVVGVVNLKDLVRATLEAGDRLVPVAEVMGAAVFVPDTKRLDDLLREMQVSKNHIAIAVDEYGGTAGLLTIEDILEEIVGEITDESDTDERPPVEHLDDGAVRVSSRLPVEDLGALFGLRLEGQDVETVGGLLAQRLGRVPLPGAEAEITGLRFRAEGGKDNRGRVRITSVVVRPVERAETADEGAGAEQAPVDEQQWERSGERG